MAHESPDSASEAPRDDLLTEHEQVIALCLTQGLTNAEIAAVLKTPIEVITAEIEICMTKIPLTYEQRQRLRPLQLPPK